MWSIFKRRSKQEPVIAPHVEPDPEHEEPSAEPREHVPYWYGTGGPILDCAWLPEATIDALVPTPIRWIQHVGHYSIEELSRWGIDFAHYPEFQSLWEWCRTNPDRVTKYGPWSGIPRSQADQRRWAFTALGLDPDFVFSLFPALPRWHDPSSYRGFRAPQNAYGFVTSHCANATSDEVHAVIAFFETLALPAFGRPPPSAALPPADEAITWMLLHAPNPLRPRDGGEELRIRWPTLMDLRMEVLHPVSAALSASERQTWARKLAHYGLLEDFPLPFRPQWERAHPPLPPADMPIAHAVPIVDCLLDSRIINGAIAAGHWWLGDLMQLEAREILALPGVGKKTAYAFCDERHSTRIHLNLRSNRSLIQHVSAILAAVRTGEKDDDSAYKELAEIFGSS